MREALDFKHQTFAKFSSPAFATPEASDQAAGKGPVQVQPDQKDFIDNVW